MPSKAQFIADTNAGVFAKRHPLIREIDDLLDRYPRGSEIAQTMIAAIIIAKCDEYVEVLVREERSSKRLPGIKALREIAVAEQQRLTMLMKALAARNVHQQRVSAKAKFAKIIHNPKFKALGRVQNYGNNPELKELHSEEILEALDDLHRAGHELHKVKKLWMDDPNGGKNFWEYLDKFVAKNPNNSLYRVKYFNENERRAYLVSFQGNMLVQGEGRQRQKFDTSQCAVNSNILANTWGRAIFVMSMNHEIYSGGSFSNPQRRPDGWVDRTRQGAIVHHSSFLMGSPVRCAGEWVVKNGAIIMISPQSGHYRPPAPIFQAFLKMLESRGVPLQRLTVGLFFRGANHFYNAREYAYASDAQTTGSPINNGQLLREVINMRSPNTYKQMPVPGQPRPAVRPVMPPSVNHANQPSQFRSAPPIPPRQFRPAPNPPASNQAPPIPARSRQGS